jgi:rhodanese-related sulfurtransferase
MKKMVRIFTVALMVSIFATGIAYADDPVPITAEQAFDLYANQEETGANVAIVDIRTTAEYHWVGTCAKVKIIITEDEEITPDNGKVIIRANSRILEFEVDGEPSALNVKHVEKIETSVIARHIPYMTWDDEGCEKVDNDDFAGEIEALASQGIDIIIMMCRSGKRTSKAEFNFGLFEAVYEIDQPDGKNGRGGFQGTSYGDAYNGFRDFPGRKTSFQEHESVSWSNAGLPIHIGSCPEDDYSAFHMTSY